MIIQLASNIPFMINNSFHIIEDILILFLGNERLTCNALRHASQTDRMSELGQKQPIEVNCHLLR
jgi:hypothetical protein